MVRKGVVAFFWYRKVYRIPLRDSSLLQNRPSPSRSGGRKLHIRLLPKAIFLFLILFFPQILDAEKVWQAQNTGITDANLRSIAIFSENDDFICTASSKQVYFSQNGGNLWNTIFSLEGQEDEINFIAFDTVDPKIIYLATTKGLLATKDQGKNWQRVFRKVKDEQNNVRWIAQDFRHSQIIYLGTTEGLYVSEDKGASWSKNNVGLPRSEVRSVMPHPSNSRVLYLANTYGLFKTIDGGQSWKRTYVTSHKVADDEDTEEIGPNQSLINCIAIDRARPKTIFIATGEGVFTSEDAGESWNKLPDEGLRFDYVNFILTSDEQKATLYAATNGGVFEFSGKLNSWQEIYQGMTARDVRSLALTMNNNPLWAATEKGAFKTIETRLAQKQEPGKVTVHKTDKISCEQVLRELTLSEPTIQQIQQAALRYGEVIHPQQIQFLRRNARLKALLPDVSVDYDKTINYDSGSDTYYVGPHDWGFSFSWDVGDLVFSEQLRLIDTNARLAVQLRGDILNEITRLYYARRKLQTELILTPPKTPQEKLTKTLRLEELTANIDALTGNYLSRNLKR